MDDRRSHWPIYDVVPIEMIKIVSNAVRRATVETVEGKNGMVVYFRSKGVDDGSTQKNRGRINQ